MFYAVLCEMMTPFRHFHSSLTERRFLSDSNVERHLSLVDIISRSAGVSKEMTIRKVSSSI